MSFPRSRPRSHRLLAVLVVSAGLLAAGPSRKSPSDPWADLLAVVGLTPEQLRFDYPLMTYYGAADGQTPLFAMLHERPLRIPTIMRMTRRGMLSLAEDPDELLVSLLSRVGIGTQRGLAFDPLAAIEAASKQEDALAHAILHLHTVLGKPLGAPASADLRRRLAVIPAELAPSLALLIEAEIDAWAWRQRALGALAKSPWLETMFDARVTGPKLDGEDSGALTSIDKRLMGEVDRSWLMVGGLDLAIGVTKVVKALKGRHFTQGFHFDWPTPLGRIVVNGAGNDVYPAGVPYLLILDAAGDDTYYGGGGSFDAAHPISVIVDVEGNDRYLASPRLATQAVGARPERKTTRVVPSFGAGVLGYGFVADLAGNDTYRAFRETMGRGNYGIGVLWDLSGDDHYECYTRCEGAGDFGGGLLLDGSGRDEYRAFQAAQGFGGPGGGGMLLDAGTDPDTYIADNTTIDFPAIVDRRQNTSFMQGAGLGVRADYIDNHSLAGGVGMLVDGGGDNTFRAGFFAQGIGYWYGVGILSVGSGNDRYEAGKYAQGAATHFAIGVLQDTGGDDSYHVEQELGLGEGHDFGVGVLVDDAGNDTYAGGNLSFGCATSNGIGIFWDRGGDDKYTTTGEQGAFGCAVQAGSKDAQSARLLEPTIGLFLDSGGTNTFSRTKAGAPVGTVSHASWRNLGIGPTYSLPLLFGAGMVVDAPKTADPHW